MPADQFREGGVIVLGGEGRDEIGIGRRIGGRSQPANHSANSGGRHAVTLAGETWNPRRTTRGAIPSLFAH